MRAETGGGRRLEPGIGHRTVIDEPGARSVHRHLSRLTARPATPRADPTLAWKPRPAIGIDVGTRIVYAFTSNSQTIVDPAGVDVSRTGGVGEKRRTKHAHPNTRSRDGPHRRFAGIAKTLIVREED